MRVVCVHPCQALRIYAMLLSGHKMGHLVSWILFSDVETYLRLVRLFQFAVSTKNDHPRLVSNSRFVARSVDPKSGSLDKIFGRVKDTGFLMPCSKVGCINKTALGRH